MILLVKADTKEAYVGLFEQKILLEKQWDSGRELSIQLLKQIENLLEQSDYNLVDIKGIVAYIGPGSYTSLRISISTANTLAYSLKIPIVGASGSNWVELGLEKVSPESIGKFLTPDYGGEVFTTKPRK
jgi:tRNA threonylcarbamoyladenosine biosynthesis protein TsaB